MFYLLLIDPSSSAILLYLYTLGGAKLHMLLLLKDPSDLKKKERMYCTFLFFADRKSVV